MVRSVGVIGGGLAGCEAAIQLSRQGIHVTLFEMKPKKRSPAHHGDHLAEIVCSNSFGSQGETTASGLLKLEMESLGCELLKIAHQVAVPAGKALAVDRDAFAEAVTERVQGDFRIEVMTQEVSELPAGFDYTVIATGPLTTPGLVETLSQLVHSEQLYFFDAASPIILKDTINFDVAFYQDRYDKTHESDLKASYINCPLDQDQYQGLLKKIQGAERIPLKEFEASTSVSFFESCLPIEVLASRGTDTLRYGPMKPVGLIDPRTGKRPYAVIQLRQDNQEATLYNMVGFQTNLKWGEQKEIIQMIPGLEMAEVVRYGVMHRNTYVNSPEVLEPTLQLRSHPNILIAGQLTGTEGYTESIATGLVSALQIGCLFRGAVPKPLPKETMLGALLHYITRPEAIGKNFQPINSNWGILPELTPDILGSLDILDPKEWRKKLKDKVMRNALYVQRSQSALHVWQQDMNAKDFLLH